MHVSVVYNENEETVPRCCAQVVIRADDEGNFKVDGCEVDGCDDFSAPVNASDLSFTLYFTDTAKHGFIHFAKHNQWLEWEINFEIKFENKNKENMIEGDMTPIPNMRNLAGGGKWYVQNEEIKHLKYSSKKPRLELSKDVMKKIMGIRLFSLYCKILLKNQETINIIEQNGLFVPELAIDSLRNTNERSVEAQQAEQAQQQAQQVQQAQQAQRVQRVQFIDWGIDALKSGISLQKTLRVNTIAERVKQRSSALKEQGASGADWRAKQRYGRTPVIPSNPPVREILDKWLLNIREIVDKFKQHKEWQHCSVCGEVTGRGYYPVRRCAMCSLGHCQHCGVQLENAQTCATCGGQQTFTIPAYHDVKMTTKTPRRQRVTFDLRENTIAKRVKSSELKEQVKRKYSGAAEAVRRKASAAVDSLTRNLFNASQCRG